MTDHPRILFVDDEALMLEFIQRYFLDEPYEILTAASGKEGLEILENAPAEVVVSDYRMPGMSGVEFLKHVGERWPETSRLLLSGYADLSSVITAINDGEIFKFIGKPWDDQELKNAVRDGVEKHRSLVNLQRVADESLLAAADLLQEGQDKRDEAHFRNLKLERDLKTMRMYEAVFHSLDLPILCFNHAGHLQELNDAALRFLEKAGSGISKNLLDKELPADLRCAIWNTLNGVEADLQRLEVALKGESHTALVIPLSLVQNSIDGAVLAFMEQ